MTQLGLLIWDDLDRHGDTMAADLPTGLLVRTVELRDHAVGVALVFVPGLRLADLRDAATLRDLQDAELATRPPDGTAPAEALHCPNCDVPMQRVDAHRCRRCGKRAGEGGTAPERAPTDIAEVAGRPARDETKPPPGWLPHPRQPTCMRQGGVELPLERAWRIYDAEHGYAPHPSGTEWSLREALEVTHAALDRLWNNDLAGIDVTAALRRGAQALAASPPDGTAPVLATSMLGADTLAVKRVCDEYGAGFVADIANALRGTAPERAPAEEALRRLLDEELNVQRLSYGAWRVWDDSDAQLEGGGRTLVEALAEYDGARDEESEPPATRPPDGMPGEPDDPPVHYDPEGCAKALCLDKTARAYSRNPHRVTCSWCRAEAAEQWGNARDAEYNGPIPSPLLAAAPPTVPGEPAPAHGNAPRCPKCGTANYVIRKRCRNCGDDLVQHPDPNIDAEVRWDAEDGLRAEESARAAAPPTVPGEPPPEMQWLCEWSGRTRIGTQGRDFRVEVDGRVLYAVGVSDDALLLYSVADNGSIAGRAIAQAWLTKVAAAPPTVPGEPTAERMRARALQELGPGKEPTDWYAALDDIATMPPASAAPPTVPAAPAEPPADGACDERARDEVRRKWAAGEAVPKAGVRHHGTRSDGKWGCDACCNGDRCDDRTHVDRRKCGVCKGSGAIPPEHLAAPPTVPGEPPDALPDPPMARVPAPGSPELHAEIADQGRQIAELSERLAALDLQRDALRRELAIAATELRCQAAAWAAEATSPDADPARMSRARSWSSRAERKAERFEHTVAEAGRDG